MIYKPFSANGLKLKSRFVQLGMTRCRADLATGIPTDVMNTFYAQRAQFGGLVITEFQPVSILGNAWPGSGALWTAEHVKAWKPIVDSVHAKGAPFFAQFGHGGRIVHSFWLKGGPSWSPSPVAAPGKAFTPEGMKEYTKPKEMDENDIKIAIEETVNSVKNAKLAGFDGVEIGAATGLLFDQFLKNGINQRKDKYGGSIENRARFLLETLDAVTKIYPSERVSVKLSPVSAAFGASTENPKDDLIYLLKQFDQRKIGFANLVEPENEAGKKLIDNVAKFSRPHFKGTIICNGWMPVDQRIENVEKGFADLVGFARYFAANPDLPERIKNKWPLQEFNVAHAYLGGPVGYTDYLTYQEAQKKAK